MDLTEIGWVVVGWIRLAQTGTSVRLLWTWYWTFGYHKRSEISLL